MTLHDKWKVTCKGTLRDGFNSQQVIDHLAKLNIDAAFAAKLMEGKPVTVKKAVDQTTAEKMKVKLETAGLDVSIEPMQPQATKPSLATLSLEPMAGEEDSPRPSGIPAANSPPLPPGQMQCPKCKTIQQKAPECTSCGIIISRYLERQRLQEQQRHATQSERDESEEFDSPLSVIWSTNLGKVAVVGIALVVIFNFMMFNQSDYQPMAGSAEAQAQVSAVERVGELEKLAPTSKEIRQLIQSRRFQEVESILSELHAKMDQDILWEGPLVDVLDGFTPNNHVDIKLMDQWVSATGSAWAYLGRGVYYIAASVDARGTAYAAHTTQKQFHDYYKLQRIAYQDLLQAKYKNKNIMPIYIYLLMAAASQEQPPSLQSLLDEAIAVNPAGYFYRYQYLRNLMPKWGGSFGQMDEFIEQTQPYYALNPRLWLLRGFATAERAHRAYASKNYNACIRLYSEALQFGAHSGWLSHRAFCLSKEGEQELAMEDITLSLEIAESPFAQKVKRMINSG